MSRHNVLWQAGTDFPTLCPALQVHLLDRDVGGRKDEPLGEVFIPIESFKEPKVFTLPVLHKRFGSARFGFVRFGSVRFGSVRFGSVRFGSVRFGSGWVG